MKEKRIFIVFVGLFFVFAVLMTSAQSTYGAIFTSFGDGTGVNINLYDDKCDAFLNGGPPPHASCTSSGLEDGCYVFQVTAPPGGGQNETLLSQDSIWKRFIKVSGGVFVHDDGICAAAAATLTDCGTPTVEYDDCGDASQGFVNTGSGEKGHDAGDGKCEASIPGNISVRLMPYADTPNHGGVYKVYATKVGDYANNCSGVFGFIHEYSNTDNFRVKPSGPPPLQGEIRVLKFCDANANGILDPAELLFGLSGWQINFTPDPNGCSGPTDGSGLLACPNLDTGIYGVSETVMNNFAHTATCVDGSCGYCLAAGTPCNIDGDCPTGDTCIPKSDNPAYYPASITITEGDLFHRVDFGNVGLSEINGRKFDDTNANGIDNDDPGIAGVKILLKDEENSVIDCKVTDVNGEYSFTNLLPGTYTVEEIKPPGTIPTTPTSCEKILTVSTEPDENGIITCEGETEICSFGNVCLGAGGGRTLGFWSNKNGYDVMNDLPTGTCLDSAKKVCPELNMLTGLNLRNANGTNFDPTTYTSFKNWLLAANATNMAYMLSAQLSAMELNVEANFVSGGALVYAPGCGNFITVNALMLAANTALGADGYTPSGDPNRIVQECLKNALDNANNNRNFVVNCPASFGATCL